MDFKKELENLNPQQLAAVVNNDTPLRIVAGAGSGKTRVITMKIAYLIKELNVPSWKILAVTFTNKAAKEMRTRVNDILNIDQKINPFISTFHSFCYRVLRENPVEAGYKPNFSIIDTSEQKTILKGFMKELGIDRKKYARPEAKCLSAIDGWKNNLQTPMDALSELNSDQEEYRDYARVYEKYEDYLKENNYADFNDLQIKAYLMLDKNLEIREKWRNKFDYVLVDEFQDTNELQFDIIKLLTANKNNLTVVGDPDQTIYSWRGAKLHIIMNFNKVYSNAKTIVLDRNYRSTQQILNLANDLIDKNENREKKDIYTDVTGEKVTVHESPTRFDEAKWIADKIKKSVTDGKYSYKDFYVLYRINAWSQELEKVFENNKIPYQLVGGFRFRDRKVIKDAVAYLKAVALKDNISVERVLKETPKVGAMTIDKLKNFAAANSISLYELIVEHKDESQAISKHMISLRELFIQGSSMVDKNMNINDILKFLLVSSGFEERIKIIQKNEDDEQNLQALYDQLASFDNSFDPEMYDEENRTFAFLQEEALGADDSEEEVPNKVTLLTIHSSKGLENKVVFMAGLNKDVFPSRRSIFKASEMEEERRALYVAITRAEKELYISYVNGEFSYISNGELAPSKFIKELNGDMYTMEKSTLSALTENKNTFTASSHSHSDDIGSQQKSSEPAKYAEGDVVNHMMFGEGVVVKVIGNQMRVAFSNPMFGIMLIPMDNPAISKK